MHNHHNKAAALIFSVSLAMAATASPARAMNWQEGMNPASLRGTFFSTCSECRVDANGHLRCRCVNNGGRVAAQTSVALGYCNRNGPNNINGVLSCKPIVRGSWGQSCAEANIYGSELLAACKNRGGDFRPTRFPLDRCPSMDLANIDGRLQCAQ